MARVTGIGGVFLRAKHKEALAAWYRNNLGLEIAEWGGCVFSGTEEPAQAKGSTTWSLFAKDSDYLGSREQGAMVNYRVDDLDAMLRTLRQAGVAVDEKLEESEYGRFAWAYDCEGNRFELWEPPATG